MTERVDEEGQPAPVAYASTAARAAALVTDFAIVAGGLAVLVIGGSLVDGVPGSGKVEVALLWMLILLYEPLFVWHRGATIGHRRAGLLVVDASGKAPALWRAMVRYAVKVLLGVPGVVTMFLTRRHQALHDLASGTLVVVAHPTDAPDHYAERERDADWLAGVPPASRRVATIVGWLFLAFLAFIVAAAMLTNGCLRSGGCPASVTVGERLLSYAWIGVNIVIVVAGWRGALPGARRSGVPPIITGPA